MDRLEPGTTAHNVSGTVNIRGPLDVDALGRAVQTVIDRHEILRTQFVDEGEGPIQRVVPQSPFSLKRVDLRETTADRDAVVAQAISDVVGAPFDLSQGHLLRAAAIQLADEHVLFVICLHHIVCDGWSLNVLHQEIAAEYRAIATDSESALSPLPIQFADYASSVSYTHLTLPTTPYV